MMDDYLIDGHKLYWHLDRVREWRRNKVIAPVYLEVSPVAFCNHRCIFCAYDFAKADSLKLETKTFCRRLKEMGKLGVKSILYSGEGEPLLHKDLPVFIRTARSSGIDVALATNGSLGNYNLWSRILPDLTWIRFSVDAATPETYARVHKVKQETFDRTVFSIEDAVKLKRKSNLPVTIGVQFLALKDNLGDLEKAIRLFSLVGVDYISIKPYSLHPLMRDKKEMHYTDKIKNYIERVVERNRGKVKLQIIFRKGALEKYARKAKLFSRCRALSFWGHISSAGDFYTCGVFIGDRRFKAGNIYKDDMRKIMFGPLRRNSVRYGLKRLNVKGECRLNCRMARINEFLEFIEKEPPHINFI